VDRWEQVKLGRPRADRDYFGRSTTDAPPDLASAIRLDWILDVKTELNVPMGVRSSQTKDRSRTSVLISSSMTHLRTWVYDPTRCDSICGTSMISTMLTSVAATSSRSGVLVHPINS